jgi:NADPH-dependent curcumin reductase
VMEAVLGRMNLHGRVVLCGLISGYTKESGGPSNLGILIVKRLKVEGFLILDYAARFTEGATELGKWKMMGKLKDKQTVVEGLEKAPEAINMLFTGGNIGKTLVKI